MIVKKRKVDQLIALPIRNSIRTSMLALTFVGISGCTALQIDSLTLETKRQANIAEINATRSSVPKLTLGEAMARAKLYNGESRISQMQQLIAVNQTSVDWFDRLPQLTLQGGYSSRNKILGGTSENLATGQLGSDFGTSSDQTRFDGSLGMVWSMMDFTVALLTADIRLTQSEATDIHYHQGLNNLYQQTRNAYFQAQIAAKLQQDIEFMMGEVDHVLAEQTSLALDGLKPTALEEQRQLLLTYNQLLSYRAGLQANQQKLFELAHLHPSPNTRLVTGELYTRINAKPKRLELDDHDLEFLETSALLLYPQLRVADKDVYIQQQEFKRALFASYPDMQLNLTSAYSDNSYDLQSNYVQMGSKITYNLIDAYRNKEKLEATLQQQKVLEAQRLALSMAVMTKLYISIAHYNGLIDEYDIATELLETRDRELLLAENKWQEGEVNLDDLMRLRLLHIDAQLAVVSLFAELDNAALQIYNNVGVDVFSVPSKSDNLVVLRTMFDAQNELLVQFDKTLMATTIARVAELMQ